MTWRPPTPGSEARLAVLATARSNKRVTSLVAVAVRVGPFEVTVAVFESAPVPAGASAARVPVTVIVADAPAGSPPTVQLVVAAGGWQGPREVLTAVQVIPAGAGSVTTTFVASDGPLLVATIV